MNASFLYVEASLNSLGEPVFSIFDGRSDLNLVLKTTDPELLANCLIKEQDSPGSLRQFLNLAYPELPCENPKPKTSPKSILDIFNLD